jgi:hypothetical protein
METVNEVNTEEVLYERDLLLEVDFDFDDNTFNNTKIEAIIALL